MKPSSATLAASPRKTRAKEIARARTILLVAVCFLAGLGVGAFWIYRAAHRGAENAGGQTETEPLVTLSDATRAVLKRLDSPIEIRFYSLLDTSTVPETVQAFSGRVDRLLSAYEREAGGKLKITRYNSQSNASANTAFADGIQPFNTDKGEACFLGIAVSRNAQKQALPRLSPDWEPALEPDLSRAIEQVAASSSSSAPRAAAVQTDTNAIDEVKRAIPNLASVSVEQGTRILRDAALNEARASADAMESQVKEAQQRLTQALGGGSEADQQAAMKQIQQLQADQIEKLKQIAARSQAQIQALQQLKAASR